MGNHTDGFLDNFVASKSRFFISGADFKTRKAKD